MKKAYVPSLHSHWKPAMYHVLFYSSGQTSCRLSDFGSVLSDWEEAEILTMLKQQQQQLHQQNKTKHRDIIFAHLPMLKLEQRWEGSFRIHSNVFTRILASLLQMPTQQGWA